MRRVLPVAVAAAALCFSQLPASALAPSTTVTTGTASAAAAAAAPKLVRTQFAVSSQAYGSRVEGGMIPANSDTTAYQEIGCTNLTGLDRRNFEADATLPGLGVAEGVSSRTWTKKVGNTVSSYASHSIAKITLFESPLGSLVISGVSSLSHAFNKNGKFGTSFENNVARIVFDPAVGPPQDLEIPAPNQPLVIPGLATIEIGKVFRRSNAREASVRTNVLDITVDATDSRIRVAQSNADIARGVQRGVFKGFSAAVVARAVDDNIKVGRTPLIRMPCLGTKGEPRLKDVARVDLSDQIVVRGVASGQRSSTDNNGATGTERAQVASISLAEGRVQLNAIVGQVNVTRNSAGVKSNTTGTSVGELVLDGETFDFPDFGKLEIPGLLSLESGVEQKVPNGLSIVALRIKLLDGTGATIDLGVAQLAIKPGVGKR